MNRSQINNLTYATVLHSMDAQLEDELDLKKDDTVIVYGEHDSMYYKGELLNGKKGIFPKSFVSIIKNTCSSSVNYSSSLRHTSNNYEIDNLPSYNEATSWFNNVQTDIPSYGRTLYPFKAENSNEISFKENQIVNLIRYIDENWIEIELDNQVGLAPKNYIEIIVDCSNSPSFNEDYGNEIEENCCAITEDCSNVEVEEFPPGTWAKVLFDFKAQMDGDLNLKVGDKINLLRKFNNNWVEAYNGLDLGICPLNYIEIQTQYDSKSIPKVATKTADSLFDRSTPPDNLIEFSPEKKDVQNNQFDSKSTHTTKCVNYDVLHELENDYQLTVFKDIKDKTVEYPNLQTNLETTAALKSNRTSESTNNFYEQTKFENSKNSKNSNSFSKIDQETNYNSTNFSITKRDSFDNPNYSTSSSHIYENLNDSKYSPDQSKVQNNNSSFKNQLNKSLSINKRPTPETPRRPDLPPVPKLNSSLNESFKSNNTSYHNESHHKEPIYNKPNYTDNNEYKYKKTPEINRSYINKNYLNENSFSTSSKNSNNTDEDTTKLTNRLTKMAEVRACTITELLQSERDYRSALEICYNTFVKNEKFAAAFKELNVDLKLIFSNLDEIIEVSRLLNEFLLNESSKEASSQLIGKCFLDLERQMSEAYGAYCRSHDEVIPAFRKYEENSEINRFFQRGLDQIRDKTNCFDIPSILIKPVQRLLKFPLILNELIKCTPNDNPDYEHLQNAVRMITDMATNINEFKRRNYIVCKYRKEAERSNSFSSKLSKLNLHTIKKKYSRFNYGLKSTIGFGHKNADLEFQTELNKFRSLEKSIKVFIKNITFLVEQLDLYVKTAYSLSEEMVALYGDKCKQRLIEKSKSCHYEILNKSINELKNKIEIYITDTLKRLLEKFANPELLIKKRKDKSIDLECASNKYQSNRDLGPKAKALKDEFTTAKEVYEALNQQLLQDLPMFISFGTEIFTNCIVAFITFYKRFIGNIVKQMLELLSLPPIEGCKINCSNDIVETFSVKHNLIAKKLVEDFHIVPNNIFPQMMNSQTLAVAALDKHKLMKNSKILNAGSTKNKSNYQTKENRLAILSNSKIRPESIYIVKENFEPNDILDLFSLKDDIVVVIKKKDPTGFSSRWFVDNGNSKGFLPSRILEPKNPTQFSSSSSNSFSMGSHSSNGYQTSGYSYGNPQASVSFNNNVQTHNYSDWSRSSSTNIYSEIGEPSTSNQELSIDDFDPIKQQQNYESINAQLDKDEDINLNRKEKPCNEYYRAAYDFKSNGIKQLSLNQNEIVIVKYKCDLHKNDEWWYVENTENKCGYVPSAYLVDR